MQILVIDDDKVMRGLTSSLLSTLFDDVVIFEEESSADGIACLKKNHHQIKVIICDFKMPRGNGNLVYEVWKELCPHIPFLFFTGEVSVARESLRDSKNLESTLYFFEKGESITDFENMVKECLKVDCVKSI